MKRIRRRFGLIYILLILVSSITSFVLIMLIGNQVLVSKNEVRILFMGYALKDLILIIASFTGLFIIVFALSKKTSDPIVSMAEAARELAAGNFNVQIEEDSRKDELGDLQRQFNLMIRELQGNEYLKKDFISNVSHEFKTPLALINGYGKLLAEPEIDQSSRIEYARLIVQESERLSSLTSNILRLSKLSNETILQHKHTFCLDEQIRQMLLLLEPKWSQKQIEFQLHLPPSTYYGEEDLISEIWLNLLDNAIKYSPVHGLIDISLISTQYTYMVYIRDQGCGMDAETCQHIFEQFYQGDTSHKKEGNGLGLAIAKKIAELHNGSIDCSSRPEKGATFTVYLRKEI